MSDDRPEDAPGWAAPGLPPRDPGGATAPVPGAPPPVSPNWPSGDTVPASTVPPPYAAAGAPRRARGHGWLVALISVLALILTMAVGGTVLFVTRTLPPFNGARDFLNDVSHQNGSAAGRLCAADASQADAAIQRVRDHFRGGKSFAVNPLGVNRSGDTADVDYTVNYTNGSSSGSFTLPLRLEHGEWRACPL